MNVENQKQKSDMEIQGSLLASRWDRLWASLIDTVILLCVILPAMYFTGAFEGLSKSTPPSTTYNILMGLFGLAIFALFHSKYLISNGQTIGKKVLGIKIVDLDGNIPSIKILLKRYALFFLPGQIPIAGGIFGFINVLFIFGEEKRCLHDVFAKTKVIKC